MIRFCLPPLALAVALLSCAPVFAQSSGNVPTKYLPVEQKQYGNTYKWTPATPATSTSGALYGPNRGWSEISNAEPKINTYQRLPFDKRPDVPQSQMAKIASPFTKANFGKALTVAGRAAWPIGVVLTAGDIYEYLKELNLQNIKNTPDGITAEEITDFVGFEFSLQLEKIWVGTPHAACATFSRSRRGIPPVDSYGNGYTGFFPQARNDGGAWTCYVSTNYSSNGQTVHTEDHFVIPILSRENNGASSKTLTEQEIIDKIANSTAWNDAASRALAEALDKGANIETQTPTVTGPSTVPGEKTTITRQTQVAPDTTTEVPPGTPGAQSATATTTTTTTNNNVYNNNQVTNTTTTTTVTNITNNVTNQTDTKTDKVETKEDDNQDESPTDTPLGDIPNLYERKYPEGLKGIWDEKSAEIKQTPLFNLAQNLMPTGLTSGTCPSWHVDLSFGNAFGQYGNQDVSPPCWIWDVAKIIIIASALILARALVFGG